MALVLADRVNETTTTTGTSTITLNGAQTGYQSFAAIGDGNTTYYTIATRLRMSGKLASVRILLRGLR